MAKKKLVIFPYNGNGLEALDCIDYSQFELLGFIDDDLSKKSEHYPILPREILQKYHELHVLAVPGSSVSFRNRREVISSLSVLNHSRYVSVIHPSASIGKLVTIGQNCLIMAGVVITSNAKLGNHVCILPNSVIHHDVIINDYTVIGSCVVVAGGTAIGENCYIGSGTNIINGINIGEGALVGMGSNVISSVESNAKMVGNPARNLNALIPQ